MCLDYRVLDFNIILEMLRREMHDNMLISDKQITALLDAIERANQLHPDAPDAAIYQEIAEISCKVDKLTMDLREALISFHDEMLGLGHRPPVLPMAEPPALEVDVAEPGVRITLNAILPYPIKGSVYYLHEKLDAALRRFREETPIPRPLFRERCAVVFIHHYRGDIRELRDYDNTERRCILNVLARHFLRDDSPGCILSMDILAPGERNCTEIQIMTLPRFREFLMTQNIGYVPAPEASKNSRESYQKT